MTRFDAIIVTMTSYNHDQITCQVSSQVGTLVIPGDDSSEVAILARRDQDAVSTQSCG